jgi:imidazolonepropionase-like amidohydrolase
MPLHLFVCESYFDGVRHHAKGPFTIAVKAGRVAGIQVGERRDEFPKGTPVTRAAFLMPGLAEGHAHLFLDGGQLDPALRGQHLKSTPDVMLEAGKENLKRSLAAGVTLVRDAGDRFGVNQALKNLARAHPGRSPKVRVAGLGIRGPKGYGAFMAKEAASKEEIVAVTRELCQQGDDLKVILTGIIDFEKGQVAGSPQFDLDACRLIVNTARECGKPTFAHCSGIEGLKIAVEAGIDSIEHGFFMTKEILKAMAEKSIAWVPTFSPVDFQRREPHWYKWTPSTVENLAKILASHREHALMASEMGVPLVIGSDAGSQGVPHGRGVADEIHYLLEAGVGLTEALAAATSVPRRLWGEEMQGLEKGQRANFAALNSSPYKDAKALYDVAGVALGGEWHGFAKG